MPILKIARMGHPMLTRTAQPVPNPEGPRVKQLVRNMVETMKDADGAGLAAPQVHVSRRVVIFQAPPERSLPGLGEEEAFDHSAPLTVLINPEIDYLTEEMEEGWEGCLSVPGLTGLVPRCAHIRYRGYDTEGTPIEREARGFHARVVQHECDHLDGILYPQRMTDLSKLMFTSESRHWAEALAQDLPLEEEL
ncbi:MAG: peptide deformylase [Alphaproteobacteria bacterium]|nr:MAG: peptide deformylase [Alphaproteobacteria bacterium]